MRGGWGEGEEELLINKYSTYGAAVVIEEGASERGKKINPTHPRNVLNVIRI